MVSHVKSWTIHYVPIHVSTNMSLHCLMFIKFTMLLTILFFLAPNLDLLPHFPILMVAFHLCCQSYSQIFTLSTQQSLDSPLYFIHLVVCNILIKIRWLELNVECVLYLLRHPFHTILYGKVMHQDCHKVWDSTDLTDSLPGPPDQAAAVGRLPYDSHRLNRKRVFTSAQPADRTLE